LKRIRGGQFEVSSDFFTFYQPGVISRFFDFLQLFGGEIQVDKAPGLFSNRDTLLALIRVDVT
jgi:hypothetical protein